MSHSTRAIVVALGFVLFAPPGAAQPWLAVTSPSEPRSESHLRLIEVTGHAGSRSKAGHDLVIAIDLSDSTLGGCSVDLDGDGPAAATDPAYVAELERRGTFPARLRLRIRQRDFDDTVLAAELEAAEALIRRLDPRRFRVGLIVFSNEARTMAPLGSSRSELLLALHEIRFVAAHFLRGTNLSAAIDLAQRELVPEEAPISSRELSLVLLTDGVPTVPVRGGPANLSIASARSAGMRGIRIYPFAIGPESWAAEEVTTEIARWTEGAAATVLYPSEVAAELRQLDLVDLARVEIANLTSGEGARAPRIFPDGSFDGLLALLPGRNQIRIEATHRDGTRHVVERSVIFRKSEAKDPQHKHPPRANRGFAPQNPRDRDVGRDQ